MKVTRHTPVLFVLTTAFVLHACRKDPDPVPNNPAGGGPTPYVQQVPNWLRDSTGHVIEYPSDNRSTVEGVALGRKLFYETALSDNYTMSCSSCHVQANGFSDPRQFSIGTDGSVGGRQSMGAFNLNWDQFLFWDGRVPSIEAQALKPVVDMAEMRNTWPVVEQRLQAHAEYPALFEAAFGSPGIDSMRVVKAIAQFERTLLSFNSRYDRYRYLGDMTALTTSEINGMDLFNRGAHCADCHTEPLFSSHSVRNNGLDVVSVDPGFGGVTMNPAHNGMFKVTSLRNIEVTGPYMHDGRFSTLEEVVDFYADDVQVDAPNLDNHMIPWVAGEINLNAQQRADLVAFLKTLTDQEFLTNPAFSDPN